MLCRLTLATVTELRCRTWVQFGKSLCCFMPAIKKRFCITLASKGASETCPLGGLRNTLTLPNENLDTLPLDVNMQNWGVGSGGQGKTRVVEPDHFVTTAMSWRQTENETWLKGYNIRKVLTCLWFAENPRGVIAVWYLKNKMWHGCCYVMSYWPLSQWIPNTRVRWSKVDAGWRGSELYRRLIPPCWFILSWPTECKTSFTGFNTHWWLLHTVALVSWGQHALHISNGLSFIHWSQRLRASFSSGARYSQDSLWPVGFRLLEVVANLPFVSPQGVQTKPRGSILRRELAALDIKKLFTPWNAGSGGGSLPAARLCLQGETMTQWEISL